MRIYKYYIRDKITKLELPKGAKILCVKMQAGEPCIWALVNPSAEKEIRTIVTYGTGHKLPDNPGTYIDTFFASNGLSVFHVFEVTG